MQLLRNSISVASLRNINTCIWKFGASIALFVPLAAQTTNSATIAGKVHDESGTPVRATVIATSGVFVQRAFAGADGSFQLTALPRGLYSLCVQALVMTVRPKDDPFIDSCAWRELSPPSVTLATGQALTGVALTAKRGYLLNIRVNDPATLLPAAVGKAGGHQVWLLIAGPLGLQQDIPITGHDAGGRTHGIVIAYDMPHKVFIHSSTLALKDVNGSKLDGLAPIAVQVSHVSPPPTLVVNIAAAVVQVKP